MASKLIELLKDPEPRPSVEPTEDDEDFNRIKRELHTELLSRLDLRTAATLTRPDLEHRLRELLEKMLASRQLPLTKDQKAAAVSDILDEVLGYGPLEPILRDPTVSDILVNGPKEVWVEKGGKLTRTRARFRDEDHLRTVIDRIVSAVGRRVDDASPLVDARLPDGSRVNAVVPPIALDGSLLSIRRFGNKPITPEKLVSFGAMPGPIMALLGCCVEARLNIVVSGGTGSGKTTVLNALSSSIPGNERVVTIEDAAELRLQQEHIARMETRPANLEGRGEVNTRDLVKNALRMRPDRIIVGEIRGSEAIDMLQAMNTGHDGSMCTLHANSPRHALRRIETMVGLTMASLSATALREMISDALDLIIQVARLQDGSRRLLSIAEITGMEGSVISTQEIFRFRQTGVDPDGRVRGRFESSGVRPLFTERLAARGLLVPAGALDCNLVV